MISHQYLNPQKRADCETRGAGGRKDCPGTGKGREEDSEEGGESREEGREGCEEDL